MFDRKTIDSWQNISILSFLINKTVNNISIIWWRSVLLVEETGGSGENRRPVASH
jgi:hypothetical protein